jgi:apolipoprotein N-acyltransferase
LAPLYKNKHKQSYNGAMNMNMQRYFPLLKDAAYGVATALFFSAFIYLAEYGFTCKVCDTIFALAAYTLLLYGKRRAILFSGFFIGLFWFYWIGYSFKYYGTTPAVEPFVALGFALVYTLFFGTLALTQKIYLRALILFGLTFVSPMGFNWMKPELLFINSYLGTSKLDFAIILSALALTSLFDKRMRFAPLLLLLGALHLSTSTPVMAPLKINLITPPLGQAEKWDPANLENIINMNLSYIDDAINEGYDIIVLPESAFPMFLSKSPILLDYLSEKSKQISIVTGALMFENEKHYNVTYHFENGDYKIAKKVVLVPFGEYIPLPKFLQRWVSKTFFGGASDFTEGSSVTDFTIKGVKFRNAICYEATTDTIYQGSPKFLIATSSNGWFLPSIEPTLQNLLLKYYARKYNTVVYHSASPAGTGIVY